MSEAPPIVDAVDAELEGAVREHSRMVYRIACSVLRSHHDAEDVTQETFMRLLRYRRRDRLATVQDMKGWLALTAWRASIDRKRRAPEGSEVSLDEAAEAVLKLRARGAPPEEIASDRQMSALLGRLIDTLPRDLRDTQKLSLAGDLSSAEIAQVLGIPEGSVRTRLARARQILKEKLLAVLGDRHGR